MAKFERKDDDRLLRWLELRTEGIESRKIGERFGVTAGYVRAATNRVVNHDMKLHDDQISFGEVKP